MKNSNSFADLIEEYLEEIDEEYLEEVEEECIYLNKRKYKIIYIYMMEKL